MENQVINVYLIGLIQMQYTIQRLAQEIQFAYLLVIPKKHYFKKEYVHLEKMVQLHLDHQMEKNTIIQHMQRVANIIFLKKIK